MLETYQAKPVCYDPAPDVPECLKGTLWGSGFNEIQRQHVPTGNFKEDQSQSPAGQRSDCKATTGDTNTKPEATKKSSRTPRWCGGDPLVKTIVATRRGYDHLGQALAGEAFSRGFNKAKSKTFMGEPSGVYYQY